MQHFFKQKKDYYGGGLMVLFGAVAIYDGLNHQIGSLRQMGPGYFPIALGVLLIFLGSLIAGTAGTGTSDSVAETILPPKLEWRGWFCIIAGPIAFMILGTYGGLIPGTFACVFIAALGDRKMTIKSALLLAAGVTIFGVLLFSYLLHIPMPILKWGRG